MVTMGRREGAGSDGGRKGRRRRIGLREMQMNREQKVHPKRATPTASDVHPKLRPHREMAMTLRPIHQMNITPASHKNNNIALIKILKFLITL